MYEFAGAVAQVFHLDAGLVVPDQTSIPLGTNEVLRPDMLGLDCTQTSKRLGLRTFDVVAGLGEMLASRA